MNDTTRISHLSSIIIEGGLVCEPIHFYNKAKEYLERFGLLEVSIEYHGFMMEVTEETTLEEIEEFVLDIDEKH